MNTRELARKSRTIVAWGLIAACAGGCATRPGAEFVAVLGDPGGISDRQLEIARGSLQSLNARMEIECHNLANIDTPGFKSVLAVQESLPFHPGESGGVRQAKSVLDMSQGPPVYSARSLDAMIEGRGMFQVELGGEQGFAYTRDGRFALNAAGELATLVGGHRLVPQISVPLHSSGITFDSVDQVFVFQSNMEEPQVIGQIGLTIFVVPESLAPLGGALYAETPASGRPIAGLPGEYSFGAIIHRCYEASNVDPQTSQINILRIRRERELWEGSRRAGVLDGSRRRLHDPVETSSAESH